MRKTLTINKFYARNMPAPLIQFDRKEMLLFISIQYL